jgi:hypothetical protein
MGLNNAATREICISRDVVSHVVRVASPFNPDFTEGAKRLGGKWDGTERRWVFAAKHEAEVRALCVTVYGTDNGTPTPTRESLERRLAQHLEAVVAIQKQLAVLDGEEEPA